MKKRQKQTPPYVSKRTGEIYCIGDTHFRSENTCEKEGRPPGIDDIMFKNILERCGKHDTLIFDGDVADGFTCPDVTDILSQIKCRKILIVGNHDGTYAHGELSYKRFRDQFAEIHHSLMMSYRGRDLLFSHYPLIEWDGYYKGRWLLYGHVHKGTTGPAALMQLIPTAINVGADVNNFMPMTIDELIEKRLAEYGIPEGSLRDFVEGKIFVEPKRYGPKVLDLSPFRRALAGKEAVNG